MYGYATLCTLDSLLLGLGLEEGVRVRGRG